MRNVTVYRRRMQVYSDRFETVLPKTGRFFTPAPKKSKPTDWHAVIITGIIALTVIAVLHALNSRQPPIPAAPAIVASTPPPVPLPEVRRAMPVPVPVQSVPRARLVHIRPIGTYKNDLMPDGRVLTTRYMGELAGATSLPTRGANLGDMWFTLADGHAWVLAPVAPGSSTVGWVDP